MPTLQLDDRTLNISFRHSQSTCNFFVRRKLPQTDITLCRLVEGGEAIGQGLTVRHPKDQPNRNIGRKVAFLRAMKDAHIPRAKRAELWDQYRRQTNDPTLDPASPAAPNHPASAPRSTSGAGTP